MLNVFLQRFRAKEPLRGPDATVNRRVSTNMSSLTDPNEARLFSAAPLPTLESKSGKNDTTTQNASQDVDSEPVVRDRRKSSRITSIQSNQSSATSSEKRPLPADPPVTPSEASGRRGSRIVDSNAEDVMDYGKQVYLR